MRHGATNRLWLLRKARATHPPIRVETTPTKALIAAIVAAPCAASGAGASLKRALKRVNSDAKAKLLENAKQIEEAQALLDTTQKSVDASASTTVNTVI